MCLGPSSATPTFTYLWFLLVRTDYSYPRVRLHGRATVGAGIGLLFTPKSGSQVRSSLREYVMKASDEVDQASEAGTESDAMRTGWHGEGIQILGAECGVRSGPHDHTAGDTGHDN